MKTFRYRHEHTAQGYLKAPYFQTDFHFYQNVNDLLVKDIGAGYLPMIERVMRTALVAWETYSGGDAGLEPTDDLARQAWAAMIQLRGIRDGNNILAYTNETQEISMYQLMLVNMHAELPAIVQLYAFSEQAKLLYASDQQAASGGSFLQMHSQTHRANSDGRHGHAGRHTKPTVRQL